MKVYFLLLAISLNFLATSQTVTKYYDADWLETKPEKAIFYAEFTKVEGGYKCFSYWMASKKKREESLYADTIMSRPNGLQKTYFKNGTLEDSVFYDADSKVTKAFHYYQNRQLTCYYVSTANGSGEVKEAFDESGQKIKNYVYLRSAEPKGGLKNWQAFLKKNTSKELVAKGPEPQTVKVQVQFFVDQYGYVIKPKVIESSGIKAVDQDALRLISSSPEWSPAIYKNKPFRFPVTQPLIYELQPAKK